MRDNNNNFKGMNNAISIINNDNEKDNLLNDFLGERYLMSRLK
jgi:hypothetical protein